jgi:hypothetical protein
MDANHCHSIHCCFHYRKKMDSMDEGDLLPDWVELSQNLIHCCHQKYLMDDYKTPHRQMNHCRVWTCCFLALRKDHRGSQKMAVFDCLIHQTTSHLHGHVPATHCPRCCTG